jgi:hypothetical protein
MSKPRATTKRSRRAPAGGAIPNFALYGETPAPQQETLHIEEIQSRSRLHQWEIKPHVHQGLYQIVWLHRGRAEVGIDEWSGVVVGPAAIVAPPGVVHGFRFAPEADGLVLTLSARFLVEGELPAAAEAFRTLFLTPAAVSLTSDDGTVRRLDALMRALAAEFATPGGGARRFRCGSPARSSGAWRRPAPSTVVRKGRGGGVIRPYSPAFSCWSRSIFSTAGRSSVMPAPSACRTRASTGSRGRRLEARRSKSSMSA